MNARERQQLRIMAEEFSRGVDLKTAVERTYVRAPLVDKYSGKTWTPQSQADASTATTKSA
ncbi:MAG: hypothetical protein ABR529_13960 [Actinomycetota bacterium]